MGVWTQPPVPQVSWVQGSLSLQSFWPVTTQVPAMHTELVVHWSPSSHSVPLSGAPTGHTPVVGSQVAGAWQTLGGQDRGVPRQVPPEQPSLSVQALPSLQPAPSRKLPVVQVQLA
jgi:hypothetical protein